MGPDIIPVAILLYVVKIIALFGRRSAGVWPVAYDKIASGSDTYLTNLDFLRFIMADSSIMALVLLRCTPGDPMMLHKCEMIIPHTSTLNYLSPPSNQMA